MADHFLRTSLRLAVPRPRVFAFFGDVGNLARITPPELAFRIRTPLPVSLGEGSLIDYTIGLYGIPMRWRTRIVRWRENEEFVDEQLRGPYALWVHRHSFRDDGSGGTIIEDEVRYRLPLSPLGDIAHPLVRRQLASLGGRSDPVRLSHSIPDNLSGY
ncbi:MAG TPA: SRPBCC family protein [Gemmatimonadaceae bacterium]|nr:SRPBCC family protein [Gemmatimonadaceae bacterium]